MNLYKIAQEGYDTYKYIIVVAEDETAAAMIMPEGVGIVNIVRNQLWGYCRIRKNDL